jgi:hypothetical protein
MSKKGIRITVISVGALCAALVFGDAKAPENPILFDHGLHVHDAEMACADCHSSMETLAAGAQSALDHDACESCHDVDDESECGTCHKDPESPEGVPPREGLYEGFAHSRHAEAKVPCGSCHGEVTEAGIEPRVPNMTACQDCHLTEGAALDCGSCHMGKSPLPEDHRVQGWMSEHGLDAAFDGSSCEACHSQGSCDDCHQGAILQGKPHPPSWLFDHFLEAGYGQDCLVCHETRESCTSCHRAMVPVPHEFGPDYANARDGGAHKAEAEAFMEACVSCHDVEGSDPTCARCHD